MRTLILMLLITSIAISCNKNDDQSIPQNEMGEWRLVSVVSPMVNETTTYDHLNIILSFNGETMTVRGNDGSFFIENGTYKYVFMEKDEFPTHTIKINDTWKYAYSFGKGTMIFSWAFLDGVIITFRK